MSLALRLWDGGILNQLLIWPAILFVSERYMRFAEGLTGDNYDWPAINFMSSYEYEAHNGYLLLVSAVLTLVAAFSAVFPSLVGASPGKALLGVKYQARDGSSAGARRLILRGVGILLLVALIFLAGPVLGFVFGSSADPYSLAALGLGLLFAVFTVAPVAPNRPSFLNRWAGVRPALRRPIATGA